MKIIVNGAAGRMGKTLRRLIAEGFDGAVLAGAVDTHVQEKGVSASLEDLSAAADCIIDFSSHTGVFSLLGFAVKNALPTVIATTGHTPEEHAAILAAANTIPVFCSSNLSLGTAVLVQLVQQTAAAFPDADIEIVEAHHSGKTDVPSGTALMLGNAVQSVRGDAPLVIGRRENGKRAKGEIGIHSLRMGGEVGMHEVILSDGVQTIALRHEVRERAVFAEGALRAARFVIGKAPGLYTMKDIVKWRSV